MIDPHEADEAEYAATLAWEAKVQRARDRLDARNNTQTPA